MHPRDFDRIRKDFINEVFGDNVLSVSYSLSADIHLEKSEVMEEIHPSMAPPLQAPSFNAPLEELIHTAKQSITLGAYIRQKAHRLDMVTYRPALFEQGQISRDYWSRLLNDEIKASKEKLLRVAILLRLSTEEAAEMLVKAGYSLSEAILRDLVVQYCLTNQYFDFVVVEQLLADYEIQSLFNDRRGA